MIYRNFFCMKQGSDIHMGTYVCRAHTSLKATQSGFEHLKCLQQGGRAANCHTS